MQRPGALVLTAADVSSGAAPKTIIKVTHATSMLACVVSMVCGAACVQRVTFERLRRLVKSLFDGAQEVIRDGPAPSPVVVIREVIKEVVKEVAVPSGGSGNQLADCKVDTRVTVSPASKATPSPFAAPTLRGDGAACGC